jgi:hypothetical protein
MTNNAPLSSTCGPRTSDPPASGRDGRMSLHVARLRAGFPSLASGTARFDGPGGTQTPAVAGQAIVNTLTGPLVSSLKHRSMTVRSR